MEFALKELPQVVANITHTLEIMDVQWQGVDKVSDQTASIAKQPMELMLWEILENSKKFHPHNNPLITIAIDLAAEGYVTLRICDDGGQLAPEDLAQIWVPYYQSEKNFTGEIAGMGLGLPTVATIVWGVGGECQIFNLPETDGVAVELTIPLGQPAVIDASSQNAISRPLSSKAKLNNQ